MPEPFGTFYSGTYTTEDGTVEGFAAENVATEEGRAALHAHVDEAIDAGATSITITKQ